MLDCWISSEGYMLCMIWVISFTLLGPIPLKILRPISEGILLIGYRRAGNGAKPLHWLVFGGPIIAGDFLLVGLIRWCRR